MRSGMIALVGVLVVGGSMFARSQGGTSPQGVWRVTEVVTTGANASANKNPQPGLYIFTKQHYSIISVGGTAPRTSPAAPKDPANLTDAEKLARYEAWDPFTANAGTYKISGSTLSTQPLVAKNPSVMSRPASTREFTIAGNTMTLIQKSAAGQPASETRTTLTRVE
jgi:hypothetical protein